MTIFYRNKYNGLSIFINIIIVFFIIQPAFASPSKVILTANLSLCPTWGYCEQVPVLNITAATDPNTTITAVIVQLGADTIRCPGQVCLLELTPTPPAGVPVQVWAELGDGSVSLSLDFWLRHTLPPDGSPGHYVYLLGQPWEHDAPAWWRMA